MNIQSATVERFWSQQGTFTLEERVYQFLHNAIASGDARPGSTIVGSQLAEKLGVSRITVTNALRRLSSGGFVIVYPHRGAVVASLDVPTLNEIFRIRYALESEVMTELATSVDSQGLTRLRLLDEEVRDSLLGNDTVAYRQLERRFHLLVYELSGLPMMCSMLTDLWNRLEPYRGRRYTSQMLVQDALDDHRLVLAALADRDAGAAVSAMRTHVERGHHQLLHVLEPTHTTGSESALPVSRVRAGIRSSRREAPPAGSLRAAFASLPDARRGQGRMYAKGDILTLTVCAMLCGARSQYAVSVWIAGASTPVREAVGWHNKRIPSGPTIHRVLAGVENREIEQVLAEWLSAHDLSFDPPNAAPHRRGIHGEQLPGIALVECVADILGSHLRSTDSRTIRGERTSWNRFFGRVLHGNSMPSDITPPEMQLRMAFMHTVGSEMA